MKPGKFQRAKLSLIDGRFKLTEHGSISIDNGKDTKRFSSVRYPQVQILKNRIRIGCTTITREAMQKLLEYDLGYVQGEAV